MKKVCYFIALAFAAIASASCNKQPVIYVPEPDQEMSFMAVNQKAVTKGYVEGAVFEDTPYDNLHQTGATKTPRAMRVSAYLTPQNGTPGIYFTDENYAKNDADGFWHATPARYWPIGGSLDFLAYSTLTPFGMGAVHWDSVNSADKVMLEVGEAYRQDDILYASVSGRESSTGAASVPMEFKHAQAWIEFRICASQADVVLLNEVVLEDVYKEGDLTISNNRGDAVAAWDFRKYTAADLKMDDTYEVYKFSGDAPSTYLVASSGPGNTNWAYLDMLIPEQEKTAIILKYELAGNEPGTAPGTPGQQLTYRFDLSHEMWLAGKKYVYDITMGVNEITVSPTVAVWGDGVVADLSGDIL